MTRAACAMELRSIAPLYGKAAARQLPDAGDETAGHTPGILRIAWQVRAQKTVLDSYTAQDQQAKDAGQCKSPGRSESDGHQRHTHDHAGVARVANDAIGSGIHDLMTAILLDADDRRKVPIDDHRAKDERERGERANHPGHSHEVRDRC